MIVLVTGATGFVGSHTVAALTRSGHEVVALVRDPRKLVACPALRDAPPATVRSGDVTDRQSVRDAVAGCDAVVHTAGLVALDERRAAEARHVNVDGTRNVVGSALDAGAARVIHISTVALFGLGDFTATADSPLSAGAGPYVQSKLAAEEWVRDRQADGAPVTALYPSGILGPDSPTILDLFEAMILWVRFRIRTEGGTSIVDVRDLARLIGRLVDDEAAPPRVMAGGTYLSWPDLLATVGRVTGRDRRTIPIPGPMLRAMGTIGDLAKQVVPRQTKWTREGMETATRSPRYDSDATVERYGAFRPADVTIAVTIEWLHRAGHLSARAAGDLAPN